MLSPFPGMDPYLEDPQLWPNFHRQLIAALAQGIFPALGDRRVPKIEQRCYNVLNKEDQQEDYLEIRQSSNSQLITLIEVVSPANKTTPEGREAYLNQRTQAKGSQANLVEIDLVLQGLPMLDYSREGLPDWAYAVTVTRSAQPERYEIYTATVQKRLPRFRVPMAEGERDIVVDLQVTFTKVYAALKTQIDYHRDPLAPLSEADYRWLDDLLVRNDFRRPAPPEHVVAALAYQLWEHEGHPHGRDREHWRRALELLRRQIP